MKILLTFVLFVLVCSCEKSENYPSYSPPEDHTVSKEGVMHKSGLEDPMTNCAVCHGSDLQGGTVGVSCYECHKKKW